MKLYDALKASGNLGIDRSIFGKALRTAGATATQALAGTRAHGDQAYQIALQAVRTHLDATGELYSDEIARNIAYSRTWEAGRYTTSEAIDWARNNFRP
jgi:hypothetical protein